MTPRLYTKYTEEVRPRLKEQFEYKNVMELGGVKDLIAKCIGRTSTPINVAYATLNAIERFRTPEEILRLRGKDRKEA